MTSYRTDDERWNALVARDRNALGRFLYGVITTGVVCHPGCGSRQPNRENVEFFDTFEAAREAGFRACKRCGAGESSSEARRQKLVADACRDIETATETPKLAQLAAKAGLSPWYFQRLFKRHVGVTPKQYAASHRAQRFRVELERGNSVTGAIYDAGFGSSSRAYDPHAQRLGMAPSGYQRGSRGETVRYSFAQNYLGWVVVASTERGLCAIEFADSPGELKRLLRERFPQAELKPGDDAFSSVVKTVIAFLEEPERGLNLPLDVRGTAFQQRVWTALRDVLSGCTVSYTDIAARIGQPGAVRAVAGACAGNKLAVAIPCHRVIKQNGELSGYRWGVERKKLLLARERSDRTEP
ncbi:MAG: bifunctional DNA-binding transcriptional regulator/O6-methylguanine-DNA methyltransferase Ada [Gammaproteobacteria bacterium]|nr:bifunctional DNA-binding transcriptional regulator/O6-methylguanine-DNA methyltransferase Ada [Gammaproteobacteria bacterium]